MKTHVLKQVISPTEFVIDILDNGLVIQKDVQVATKNGQQDIDNLINEVLIDNL